MLSILWTTIQLLLSGFFVNFPEVGPPRPRGPAPPRGALLPTAASLTALRGARQSRHPRPPPGSRATLAPAPAPHTSPPPTHPPTRPSGAAPRHHLPALPQRDALQL
jgi:hypothetical protein